MNRNNSWMDKLAWPLVALASGPLLFCFYEIRAKDLESLFNWLNLRLVGIYACCIFFAIMVINRWSRRKSSPLLLLPFLVIGSGHGEALPALAIFCAGSLAVGSAIVRVFGLTSSSDSPTERVIVAFFSGVCLNGLLAWCLMHFAVRGVWVYNLYPVAEALIFHRCLSSEYWNYPKGSDETRWSNGQVLIFIHACLMLVYQLVPSYNCDDVGTHLYIPKVVLLFGSFDFSPKYIGGLNAAITPMGVYTSLFLSGGETAVRLVNFIAFYAGALLLEDFTRRNLNERSGFWSTAAALATPYITWILGVVFTDSFFFLSAAVICTYSLRAVKSDGSYISMAGFGLLSAFGFLCKLQIILILLPCAVLVAIPLFRSLVKKGDWRIVARTLLGSVVFLGVIAIPLIHNYLLSGNPLFPFYNGIFKSPHFPAQNFKDLRWAHPLNWRSLYEITFQGTRYVENMNLSYGFWNFCLAVFYMPAMFGAGSRKGDHWLLGALLIFITSTLLLFWVTGPYMRYGLGSLVSGAIVIGYTIDWLIGVCESNRFALGAMRALMWVLLLLNLACQFSIVNVATPYPVMEAFRGDLSRSSVAGYQEMRRVFDFATAKFGRHAKGLLIDNDNPALYFAGTKIESSCWYFPENSKALHTISDAQTMVSYLFDERKFDYIIMPERGSSMPVLDSLEFRSLLHREFSYYGYGLYVPRTP